MGWLGCLSRSAGWCRVLVACRVLGHPPSKVLLVLAFTDTTSVVLAALFQR